MDKYYLLAAAKYVLLNPVRAKLVKRPEDWRFSSVGEHLSGNGFVIDAEGLGKRVKDWQTFLSVDVTRKEVESFRKHSSTGRPMGAEWFVKWLEDMLKRRILPKKVGRKPGVKEP